MKILMVSNEFPPSIGGVQTHVDELSRALVGLGHQVDVLTRLKNGGHPVFEESFGVHIHRASLAVTHLIYDWQMLRKAKEIINQRDIELVHVHGMRPLTACGKLSLPIVFTNHTSSFMKRFSKGGSQHRKMLRQLDNATLVTAPSMVLAEATRQTGYEGPVHFVSNGVDVNRFFPDRSSFRESLGIAENDFVILFSGRLHKIKGIDILEKALKVLHSLGIHLIVAGDGSERGHFEKAAEEYLGTGHVHMLGAVANTTMPDVYRAADLLVLPSLMEATSIAGLEAMACGLPVIGTRVGGLPYIIKADDNGLLVAPENPEELAQAIRRLYHDRVLAAGMGRNSRKRVLELFAWEKIAEQMAALYQQALEIS